MCFSYFFPIFEQTVLRLVDLAVFTLAGKSRVEFRQENAVHTVDVAAGQCIAAPFSKRFQRITRRAFAVEKEVLVAEQVQAEQFAVRTFFPLRFRMDLKLAFARRVTDAVVSFRLVGGIFRLKMFFPICQIPIRQGIVNIYFLTVPISPGRNGWKVRLSLYFQGENPGRHGEPGQKPAQTRPAGKNAARHDVAATGRESRTPLSRRWAVFLVE